MTDITDCLLTAPGVETIEAVGFPTGLVNACISFLISTTVVIRPRTLNVDPLQVFRDEEAEELGEFGQVATPHRRVKLSQLILTCFNRIWCGRKVVSGDREVTTAIVDL
jgi:hypothetical protein